MNFFLVSVFSFLILICITAVAQYGNEEYHHKLVKIENYQINKDSLIFNINDIKGKYEIFLPNRIKVKNNDDIKISYHYYNGLITEIENIVINNKSVWDVSDQNRIKIRSIK